MSSLARAANVSSKVLTGVCRRSFGVLSSVRQATTPSTTAQGQSLTTPPGFRAPGQIPTDWEVATGAERYELLKRLAGEEPWEDLQPVYLAQRPTKKNPAVITGVDPERYIACTGFPADSHEAIWLTIRDHGKERVDRCPHCGNAFKYEQEHAHH
ncbi:cytochrome c oxidase subunit VB-domain-containing protein [Gaertneriomyces semiglobifer]|nr:cytochrome c oxidase subunit VB-domain-containing protein [Gaertneriomyces semiglobifer]